MGSELARVIEQVEKDKGINRDVLVEALESALVMAAKKKFGFENEIEAHFNMDLGEIELFQFKTVVEAVANPATEVVQAEAQKLDPDVALGDSIGMKLDSTGFGRIAAQTAKQVIIQKVRDAERDIIYKEFNVRKGELVSGSCRRIERGCLVVDLGRTDAILPGREQIPGEHYRPGDRIMGYLIDVQQTPRGPKIVLSRTCPELLISLFHQEVPEVNEGIVQIKSAAREPGIRAKIAVTSTDPDVDPVGACVGVKGARVQNVVQELRGEKIDIVPWSEDDTRFVCNALAPAEVQKVLLDEQGRSMEIVVDDTQLSLAIGKRGQNVKLASMLSGWKLDIVSETNMQKRVELARNQLMKLEGMSETLAQALYQHGFTVAQLLTAQPAEVGQVPGFDEEKAKALIEDAKKKVEAKEIDPNEKPEEVRPARPAQRPGAGMGARGMRQGPGGAGAPGAGGEQKAPSRSKLDAEEVFQRLKAEMKAAEDAENPPEAEAAPAAEASAAPAEETPTEDNQDETKNEEGSSEEASAEAPEKTES